MSADKCPNVRRQMSECPNVRMSPDTCPNCANVSHKSAKNSFRQESGWLIELANVHSSLSCRHTPSTPHPRAPISNNTTHVRSRQPLTLPLSESSICATMKRVRRNLMHVSITSRDVRSTDSSSEHDWLQLQADESVGNQLRGSGVKAWPTRTWKQHLMHTTSMGRISWLMRIMGS